MTIAARLAALEAEMASTRSLVGEIHVAVVGDGSAGSSLRERVAANEADLRHMKSWPYRGLTTGTTALLGLLFNLLAQSTGIHLPSQGGHA